MWEKASLSAWPRSVAGVARCTLDCGIVLRSIFAGDAFWEKTPGSVRIAGEVSALIAVLNR